jgi:fatty acid desaturase
LLITFGKCHGGWLCTACNNTLHIGMQSDTPDYRLSSRTFMLNPIARFLYWNMNFHIDQHMYTKVPCYRLPALHARIGCDLPPAPRGLLATWREISLQAGHRP